jgi:hypothetical protein
VTKSPLVFTLVIDGTPVAAFAAGRAHEARELSREQWLRNDLEMRTANGKPVSHRRSNYSVHQATAAQQSAYVRGSASFTGKEKVPLVFLVQLDD